MLRLYSRRISIGGLREFIKSMRQLHANNKFSRITDTFKSRHLALKKRTTYSKRRRPRGDISRLTKDRLCPRFNKCAANRHQSSESRSFGDTFDNFQEINSVVTESLFLHIGRTFISTKRTSRSRCPHNRSQSVGFLR